ncbi:hypothetical protein [Wenxinia marina]|uniref:Uncharacterized protein n=1 Tax=Wenxinia marina DSM 24838 TaxID=1123501 RepID=A0A0D0Q3U5_9RHOB|nr:hypothetical protein [Wenxinia marina]KIQ69179.1 hypothetical protein Wenmar_02249 [Wenxinia marina DSM 24838]GGL70980.1 hypothetical protein GCM10011392_26890 [Wenxinia marina]
MRHALAALVALAPAALAAQPMVRDCDTHIANARNLARPYDEAIREFANGDVVLMSLLMDEPACCGAHLMVTFPDPYEGFQSCRIVTTADEMGWGALDLPTAEASYDAATGLTVRVPIQVFDGMAFQPESVWVTVNRAEGEVTAR